MIDNNSCSIYCQLQMNQPGGPRNSLVYQPKYFLMSCLWLSRNRVPGSSNLPYNQRYTYSIDRKNAVGGYMPAPGDDFSSNVESEFPYIQAQRWMGLCKNWKVLPVKGSGTSYYLMADLSNIPMTSDSWPQEVYLGIRFKQYGNNVIGTPFISSLANAAAFEISYIPSGLGNTFYITYRASTDDYLSNGVYTADTDLWYLMIDTQQLAQPWEIRNIKTYVNPGGLYLIANPEGVAGTIWGFGPAD